MQLENHLLVQKLDAFIRKYYKNLLLKGSIIFVGLFVLFFLSITALEYFGRYNSSTRAVLFYSFLALSLFLFIRFILFPWAQLMRMGKQISYAQAAQIIGSHFKEVNDKLMNALQLLDQTEENNSLLEAAIQQKTQELSPLPFTAAVNYKQNLKYARWAIVPVLLLFITILGAPNLLSEGAQRVIQYNQVFKVPAPFVFEISNDKLEVEQYQDFELKVLVQGAEIPNEVFVHAFNQVYRMEKLDATHFSYTFKNMQQSTPFYLEALGFEDAMQQINVLKRPIILSYSVQLDYPSYLQQKDETITNPGDLQIPAGTIVKWNFTGKQTDDLRLQFTKFEVGAESKDRIHYQYSRKFFASDAYAIKLSNQSVAKGDSLYFQISVVPDAYPQISVEEQKDSITGKIVYFGGSASDDHGLSKLTFNYKFLKSADPKKVERGLVSQNIPIDMAKQLNFAHVFNLFEIDINLEDELTYYFEIWDNDGVYGAKSTQTKPFVLKAPSKQEVKEQAQQDSKALQQKMEEALKESKDLQKDLKEVQKKLKSQQPLTFEEKKKLEQLQKRQKDLVQKIEELQQDFKQKNQKEQSFKEEDQRILEKQEQLQKMYEEMLTDEMKQLMKKLEDMVKMQNKDQIQKELEKLDVNNKDVEKELDRMLEMYKEMALDQKMEQTMKDLKDLAQKQAELSKETEQKEKSNEELLKKQDELNKAFEDVKKDIQDMQKQNKDLENPKDLPDTKEAEKKIEDKLQQSKEELSKGNNKKSSKSQKEAADEMEQMQQKMQEQMDKEEEEQEEIDEKALREILENVIQLSKDQEDIMEQMKGLTGYNPQFVKMAQEQKTIKDNARMVEDSLLALSKRVPAIQSFVNREVTKLNSHLDQANNSFSTRNEGQIRVQQQYAMTRMNNLGLLLSEALQQMQQQSQEKKESKKQGKGKPSKKPGKGNKPSMSQLKKMQEEMNKQMKEGMNKNGKGESTKPGTEQFARMAAKQMAIRQQMQKMLSQMDALEKEKMGGGKQLGDLQKMMEETEKDLVNKRLTQETLMRQQEILTRLLEHEKAEKKQEEEMKREATKGKEIPKPDPKYLEKFERKNQKNTDLLQSVPLEMQPYYKQKAKEYLEGKF
ncbi:MAG: hypothetical protein Q8R57_05705 [Bacteroidota bacterium]|nr:hypothetical protein [Bacteroidota bacterium]